MADEHKKIVRQAAKEQLEPLGFFKSVKPVGGYGMMVGILLLLTLDPQQI